MKIKESHPDLNELELACKLLDELICLLVFFKRAIPTESTLSKEQREKLPDYSVVKDAIEMIASARNNNSDYPITVWLADRMREKDFDV